MKTIPYVYDVINIGYGPVSEVLALALARQGHKVAIFERWKERYPLPRAVCIDHEVYRMLAGLGLRDQLPAVSHDGPWYRWFNAEWKELLAIDWSAESISGGPEVHFVHQPTLESMFDQAVVGSSNVDINLGWEAIEVKQDSEFAELTVRHVDTGEIKTVLARYIVGADGANSMVRQTMASTSEDLGFEADWLVIDVLPNEGVKLDIPEAAQYCNPERPTTIVPGGLKDGRYFRRWEFMRLPNESVAELEDIEVAWKLLEPWCRRDQATIVRHKVYTFRSLLADSWRKGRFLIAGDAAHVMPPFMGQGMCAGLRDCWNLAWKIGMVLNGKADSRLLDTYQPERRPHVRDIIEMSMFLGKIICIPDAKKAAERDHAFFTGQVPPPAPFPCLTDGILRRDEKGTVQKHAGLLSPHGLVSRDGVQGRYDDVVGLGWVLIARTRKTLNDVEAAMGTVLREMSVHNVHIVAAGDTTPGATQDLDEKFLSFMDLHGIQTMLVRPDFYLYGAETKTQDAIGLMDQWVSDLMHHGVRVQAAETALN